MRLSVGVASMILLCSAVAFSDCIPFQDAPKKIGSNACVKGKVLGLGHSRSGTTFLDFCADYKNCPFVVVIFKSNLKDVGDVTKLEGKEIEISGKIEEYNGKAEIVLKDIKQLRGEAANIPPLPKNYDVSKHGSFSAGKITPERKTSTQTQKPSDTIVVDND